MPVIGLILQDTAEQCETQLGWGPVPFADSRRVENASRLPITHHDPSFVQQILMKPGYFGRQFNFLRMLIGDPMRVFHHIGSETHRSVLTHNKLPFF